MHAKQKLWGTFLSDLTQFLLNTKPKRHLLDNNTNCLVLDILELQIVQVVCLNCFSYSYMCLCVCKLLSQWLLQVLDYINYSLTYLERWEEIRFWWVCQIPDAELPFISPRSKQVWWMCVELQTTNLQLKRPMNNTNIIRKNLKLPICGNKNMILPALCASQAVQQKHHLDSPSCNSIVSFS